MAYTRINWQDLPSTTTPRNATNLNKMDSAIKEHDDKLLGNTSMGNVVVDSIRSKNMFDGIMEQGAYAYADGTPTYTTFYCRSAHKIPVIAGKTYTLSYTSSVSIAETGFVFFNDDTYIGSQSAVSTATVPNGANYLVFNISAYPNDLYPNNLSNIQLEEGSIATSYSPYQQLGTDGDIFVNGTLTALNQANFGTYNDSQVSGWNDAIFTKKSFIGSIQVSGTWYILINIRHRNGNDDGTNYGIQIMTPMTSTDIVQIRNQIGGTWGNWRTL